MCTVSKLGKFQMWVVILSSFPFQLLLCLVCIVTVITTELWTRVLWLVQLKRFILLNFFISFGWNWLYLFKVSSVILMAFWLRTLQL